MKPTILFVTTSSNWPLTDGKRQRTWFLIEALAKKYTIDLLLMGYEKEKEQIQNAGSSLRDVYFISLKNSSFLQPGYPSFLLSGKLRKQKTLFLNQVNDFFLNTYSKYKYEFVFSRYLEPLVAVPSNLNIKIVCDVDDVYFEKYQTRIKNENSLIRKAKLKVLFYLGSRKVKNILSRIDIPIVVKESDRSFYGLKNAACLPNLPFSFFINQEKIPKITSIDAPSKILSFGFIGKLSYKPNSHGLINFINSIWNPLMMNNFEARLVIAGSGEIPEILRSIISSSKNIDLLGFVETPEFFWNKISVLVVPIAEGGGSNIKIAEAFINGKNVIAHPFASRGYESFIDSRYLILPQNDDHWIEVMNSILVLTPEQRRFLSEKANNMFDLTNWNQSLLTIMS